MKLESHFLPADILDLFLFIKLGEIRVLENFKDADSFCRVELQRFLNQIHAIAVNMRKIVVFVGLFPWVYQVEIIFVYVRFQILDLLRGGSSCPVENPLDLIDGWTSRKHGLSSYHFPNYTPQRPYINLLGVIFTSEQ